MQAKEPVDVRIVQGQKLFHYMTYDCPPRTTTSTNSPALGAFNRWLQTADTQDVLGALDRSEFEADSPRGWLADAHVRRRSGSSIAEHLSAPPRDSEECPF